MSDTQLDAYLLTLLVEGVAAYLLAPLFRTQAHRAALAAMVGSAISHPVFWRTTLALYPQLGSYTVPALELLVVLFEAAGYRLLATGDWRIALALSAIVNFTSWLVGALVFGVG